MVAIRRESQFSVRNFFVVTGSLGLSREASGRNEDDKNTDNRNPHNGDYFVGTAKFRSVSRDRKRVQVCA
jgi:hypothetical protein